MHTEALQTNIRLSTGASAIWQRLHEAGWEAYAVGGCIRDSLLGITPHDWDFCTNAHPDTVQELFRQQRQVTTGKAHGTILVLWEGIPYEITTYRTESVYTDHRRPDAVQFAETLEEDLSRRDFTVNAMAYAPDTGLMDLHGGREDLAQGILRTVGDAHTRFTEDALRMLRAMRFCATYGFTAAQQTAAAIHADKSLLQYLSVERILSELLRLLQGKAAAAVIAAYWDVFLELLPELTAAGDDWKQQMLYGLEHVDEQDAALRWSLLLSGCPDSKAAGDVLQHYRMEKRQSQAILRLLQGFWEATVPLSGMPKVFWVRQQLGAYGMEQLRRLCRLKQCLEPEQAAYWQQVQQLAETETAAQSCTTLRALQVSGRDLCALGIPQGKQIGACLRWLLDGVMSGQLPNKREALLAAAQRYAGSASETG